MTICTVKGCGRNKFRRARFCQTHYKRKLRKEVDWDRPISVQLKGIVQCVADPLCRKKVKALGMCDVHYQRNLTHGSPHTVLLERLPGVRFCAVESCSNPRGKNKSRWCSTHAQRKRHYGDAEPEFTCAVPSCAKTFLYYGGVNGKGASKIGMCQDCYSLFGNKLSRNKRTRGLTIVIAEAYWLQEGLCKICKLDVPKLHVDHNHSCCPMGSTGCVNCFRGLLCPRCNMEVGWYETIKVAEIENYLAA